MRTIIERWARWVAGFDRGDDRGHLATVARHQLLGLLAACGGASEALPVLHRHAERCSSGPSREVVCLPVRRPGRSGGAGECLATSCHEALRHALIGGMALDHDDYLWLGHSGHSAVWVPFCLGQLSGGISLGQVLDAMVAGNELAGRLGAAAALGPLNGQMWSFIHVAGAIAAAGRLSGDPPEVLAQALAIGLAHPPFPSRGAFLRSNAKWAVAVGPVFWGLEALELARSGLSGALDLLERGDGFFKHHSWIALRGMLDGLDKVFLTETIAIKPWPGCAYLTAAIEAAVALRRRLAQGEPLSADRIAHVQLEVGATTLVLDRLAPPDNWSPEAIDNPVPITFSPRLALAHALIAAEGRSGPSARDFAPAALARYGGMIRSLADRIVVRHDASITGKLLGAFSRLLIVAPRSFLRLPRPGHPGLEALDAARVRYPFGTRLELRLIGGTEREEFLVQHPSGTRGGEVWLEVSRGKAIRELVRPLGERRVERLVRVLLEADEHEPFAELIADVLQGS